MRRNIENHNFIHPQAFPHPPTTSPRDFAEYTRFYILKFKVKDRKAKNFISEKNVSLKTLITSLSFFVTDLKYQMQILLVELSQSYSWSQDRRSMEYLLENQIAIDFYPWVKRRTALSFKFYLEHRFLLQYINSIFKEKHFSWILANAIFYWQCEAWHLSRDTSRQVTSEIQCFIEFIQCIIQIPPPPPPCWTKNLAEAQICLETNSTQYVASTSIKGWNLYLKREELIQKPDRTCLIWKIVLLTP